MQLPSKTLEKLSGRPATALRSTLASTYLLTLRGLDILPFDQLNPLMKDKRPALPGTSGDIYLRHSSYLSATNRQHGKHPKPAFVRSKGIDCSHCLFARQSERLFYVAHIWSR